jgi:GH24 family phage-related lysozyme (muramidase)
MATISLSNVIDEKNLIEFDLFTVKDSELVNELKPIKNLETSESLINFILRQHLWRGYSYTDSTGVKRIGYGTPATDPLNGLTEADSYSRWIDTFKNSERLFKRQIGLPSLSQSQYDALVSLYYFTGSVEYVGSPNRRFYIKPYIENRQWQYVASTLVLTGANRLQRQAEASIMMLADYGKYKDRSLIKEQGLQDIRKKYPDLLDITQRQQAEYVYYAETSRFLPKMTQSRKRQIVKQLG